MVPLATPVNNPSKSTCRGGQGSLAAPISSLRWQSPAKDTCMREGPRNVEHPWQVEELLWEFIAQSQPLDVPRRTCAASNLLQQTSQAGTDNRSLRKISPCAEMEGSGEGQAGWQEGRHRVCRDPPPLHSLCLPSCVSSTCCSARDPNPKHWETDLFEEEKGMKKSPDLCQPLCFHSPT